MLKDKIKSTDLWNKIKNELNRDCSRFTDGDVGELKSWMDNVLECPSNQMEELMSQIPDDEDDEWMELIDEEIKLICQQVRNRS